MSTNISKKEKSPVVKDSTITTGNNKITDINYTSEKEKSQQLFIALSDNTDELEFVLDSLVILYDYLDRARTGKGSQEGSLLCILNEKLMGIITNYRVAAQLLHEN